MSLTPRLDLRQSQSLTMTPRLQQAIRLLQMTSQELDAALAEELEKNPFLERESGLSEGEDDFSRDSLSETLGREEMPELLDSVDGGRETAPDTEEDLSSEDSFYEREDGQEPFDGPDFSLDAWSGARGREDEDAGFRAVDLCAGHAASLLEEMQSRINVTFRAEGERRLALMMTERLDEAGYLPPSFSAEEAKCSSDEFEKILRKLQEIAPSGVYARSLAECLALQLKERDRFDPAMETLVNHLDLVAKREYKKLSALCGVGIDDVSDMCDELKRLSPRPASAFETDAAPAVIPDVLVRRLKNGNLSVVLNQAALPRLLVNREYAAEISAVAAKDKAARKFMSESLSAANWLIRALNQRAETILKVASEIVERQRAFFDKGEKALTPMVLKDVAEAVAMHESTVSRVTSGKYMATPEGVFELKFFFSQGLEGADGESRSARAVRYRIRALIDAEGRDVLSDDALAVLLKKEGIEIARRTVAKYREAMGIPPSSLRKREKRAEKRI